MSKEVKRHLVMAGSECSEMVYASDYDALLAERDALAKHLSSAIRYIYTGDMRDLNLTEALAALQGAQP